MSTDTGQSTDGPMHHNTARSNAMELLRARPRTYDELPNDGGLGSGADDDGGGIRNRLAKIKLAGKGANPSDTFNGRIHTVYFLWGDERRAARRFVEANTAFVERCLAAESGTRLHQLDDVLLDLIREEYQLHCAGVGGDGGDS